MNPYKDFEDYLNDGRELKLTPVDMLFSSAKYMPLRHVRVDNLFNEKYNNVKYENICTYVFFNKETNYFYIGSGNRDTREHKHYCALENSKNDKNNGHSNYKFKNAYIENPNFIFYYVIMKNRKEAYALEQILIDLYWHDPYLLNLSRYVDIPPSTLGYKHSDDFKKKIGERSTKCWKDPEYRAKQIARLKGNTYTLGYKQTDDTKEKRAIKLRGLKRSDESKNKIRQSLIGKQKTIEHRREMSIAQVKRAANPIVRQALIDRIMKTAKAINYNGIEYTSLREASRETGIDRRTLKRFLAK